MRYEFEGKPYRVKARIENQKVKLGWFSSKIVPVLVYDVVHHYTETVHCYPEGREVDRVKVIATFESKLSAEVACRDLNEHQG